MNRVIYLFLLCAVCFAACKTNKPVADRNTVIPGKQENENAEWRQEISFSEQSTWLLGYFNPGLLKHEPYSVWFYPGYDNYQVDTAAMTSLSEISKEGLSIKIIMGTWCPDSRREVPRFMKVLDTWEFPAEFVTFIGVDNVKKSPVGGYEALDIHRVPTFIICKNNIETGRIIENPVTSLEQDMVNILRGVKNNK